MTQVQGTYNRGAARAVALLCVTQILSSCSKHTGLHSATRAPDAAVESNASVSPSAPAATPAPSVANANTVTTQGLVPSHFIDTNDDPNVVEVKLVAAEGTLQYLAAGSAAIWGYRDGAAPQSAVSVPGPTIDAKQGQRVLVHFTNQLPEATTIHWHGVRVPNHADGTTAVQMVVEPGETYDYEFIASDAGTFWYHPHVNASVQLERGLYGALVVSGGPQIAVDADRTLFLDDVKLDANGQLSDETLPDDIMDGRKGNVLIANGVVAGRLVVKSGARERWRFINAANGRYFNLSLPKHMLRVIGWDGGVISQPYETDTLLIAPGERYEVLVEFPDATGRELSLATLPYARGQSQPDNDPLPVLSVVVAGTAAKTAALPTTWGTPVELAPSAGSRERAIVLGDKQGSGNELPTFSINGMSFPDVPQIHVHKGDVEIWSIKNQTNMDHPFHVHGAFFRVLDINDVAPQHDGWKDTVNIPQQKTLRLVIRHGEPGMWMYHCHILEHAEHGMMGELMIEPASSD
jgi:FtsP/CotA-like multicopper oxidase with cupredoxin domain